MISGLLTLSVKYPEFLSVLLGLAGHGPTKVWSVMRRGNTSQGDSSGVAKNVINLLHEIFNNFLMEGPYQNSMVEVFNVPEE